MPQTNGHHAEVKDAGEGRFSSDLETLKDSFTQLRSDVARLVENTSATGRSGAGMLKNRGVESIEKIGQKIGERPLLSTAIAVAVGFILAKLLTMKR